MLYQWCLGLEHSMTLVSIPTFEYDGITVITCSQSDLWSSSSKDISPHSRKTFGYNVIDEFISCDMRFNTEGTSVSIDLITVINSQISSYVYVCSKKCLITSQSWSWRPSRWHHPCSGPTLGSSCSLVILITSGVVWESLQKHTTVSFTMFFSTCTDCGFRLNKFQV